MGFIGIEKTRLMVGLALWGVIVYYPNMKTMGSEELPDAGYFEKITSESTLHQSENIEKSTNTPVEIPQRIVIKKISLDVAVVDVAYTLQKTWIVPASLAATSKKELNIGDTRNVSIWGHRESVFARLGEIELGDEIVVFDNYGSHEYKVAKKFIVSPKDVWVMNPTQGYSLTLITCDPPHTRENRLILRARLDP